MAGSITDSGLAAINQNISVLWKDGFSKAQDNLPWNLLATDLGKSSAAIRAFDWMGGVGAVHDRTREGQHFSGVRRGNFTATHTEYGLGLTLRLRDLNTDQYGHIPPLIKKAAARMAGHPGQLLFDQLEANPTAADGAALFANTHTLGAAANWDNLTAGTGVTTTAIETDLATAQALMFLAQDDTGQPMELEIDTLVIPAAMRLNFEKVLGPLRQAGGTDSQLGNTPKIGGVFQAGGLTVIVSGRLTDANNWYAFHTQGEVKPFIYSWIVQPHQLNTPSLNDASATELGELRYVWHGDYAIVPTLPQYAVSVVN